MNIVTFWLQNFARRALRLKLTIKRQSQIPKRSKFSVRQCGNRTLLFLWKWLHQCFNAAALKRRYCTDKRSQLTAVERYDNQGISCYRIEEKFWGKTKANADFYQQIDTDDPADMLTPTIPSR